MLGGSGAAADVAEEGTAPATAVGKTISGSVEATPFVDTHEYLCEEQVRLNGVGPDDWSLLLAGYLGSDLRTASLDRATYPTRVKVPNAEMRRLDVEHHEVCPEWNYTISPRQTQPHG